MHILAFVLCTASVAPSFVHVPSSAAMLIQTHLGQIVARGWAHPVPGDLYHAHLLLPPSAPEHFESLDQLFAASIMILYHSDEMLVRWRIDDGDLPVPLRRPRSIIGYPDGSIVAAVTLLTDPASASDYEWYGTVHSDDLAHQLPDMIAEHSDRQIRIGRRTCVVNLIIDISPGHEPAPIISADGQALTLTMDCVRGRE